MERRGWYYVDDHGDKNCRFYLLDSGFGPLGTSCLAAPYCRFVAFLLCLGWNSVVNFCVVGGCKRSRLADDEWDLVITENSVGWSKRVTIKRRARNSDKTSGFVEVSQSALLALAIDIGPGNQ